MESKQDKTKSYPAEVRLSDNVSLTAQVHQLPLPSSLSEDMPFTQIKKEKKTQYLRTRPDNTIKEIDFNQEWGLNSLSLRGNFRNWNDIKRFDEGVLGRIKIDNDFI